jgi:metal-responsive CopG/Arc/MetJ family transcriptional regulator
MMLHMARRQVIVQLDERLLSALDEQARALGINRSELLRRAAAAYLDASREAQDERQMIEAYRRNPEDEADTSLYTRLAIENWPN